MSRESKRIKLEEELMARERLFAEELTAALRVCAVGNWGLFGAYESYDLPRGIGLTAESLRLTQAIREIDALRNSLGYTEQNSLCARFLAYRNLHGANDLGEPKLAQRFLDELADADPRAKARVTGLNDDRGAL